MRLGNKTKKISFRISYEHYYSLYSLYEKYQASIPNLTFSDFIRNLLLSLSSSVNNENKTNV